MANPLQNALAQAKLRLERARAGSEPIDVTIRIFKRFSETDGGSYAAALTYYLFFSIFPLLTFGAAILGYVTFGNQELQKDIFDKAVESFPMLRDAFSPEGFRTIESNRHGLALAGLALALYSGSGAIVALEHALNKVHRIQNEPNFFEKRLRSLKWLGVLGLSVLVSVGLTSLARTTASVFDAVGPIGQVFSSILFAVLALGVSTMLFATAFRFLPAKDQGWADVLPGALVGGVIFEILKLVSSLFLKSGAEGRNATFGVFATAATILVVCYLSSQVTLLAAEVNAVLEERRITREPAVSETGKEQT
ncbi:MAG: YihY/virulence factor BrkB family protein [Actinomycetota bacterium]|nr:YihY/virulence factor BrkB family protein [Actinomycetota bacterium]